MVGATVGRERPPGGCGEYSPRVSSRYLESEESPLYSRQVVLRLLRRGFCRARSSAWRVTDLVIGRSCRVGSLGRLQLNIHSLLLVYEKTQITKRAKSVAD